MRIAIMGSGGIGGYYGGRLAQAGNDVTFIARGAHLDALRSLGLRVESTLGDFALPTVQATNDPAAVGHVELVLMATKVYDLDAAAEAIRPMVGPRTAVLPLLNGVDVAQRIGAVVGAEHVLGGLCVLSSVVAEPGLIRHVSPFEKLTFGEFSGEDSPRCRAILETLKQAGINAELSAQVRVELWKKFVFLAAGAGVACLARMPPAEIRHDVELRSLFGDAMEEIVAVAERQTVFLPGGIVEDTMRFVDSLPSGIKPSMLVDLERGRPLEVEALNGTVVRMGRELNVPTPVNRAIYAALRPHAQGRQDW